MGSATPAKKHGTHCTGGWKGPRAGWDVSGRSRLSGKSRPNRDSNSGHSNPWKVDIPTEPSRPPYYTHSSKIWRVRLASQRQAYECDCWSTSSDLPSASNRVTPPHRQVSVLLQNTKHSTTTHSTMPSSNNYRTFSKQNRSVSVLHSESRDL
jgi:hypothetical protein